MRWNNSFFNSFVDVNALPGSFLLLFLDPLQVLLKVRVIREVILRGRHGCLHQILESGSGLKVNQGLGIGGLAKKFVATIHKQK